jgi:DNA-binding CsgD family transcriptional regulator
VEFLLAGSNRAEREALRAALFASGLADGSSIDSPIEIEEVEIETAERLQTLLGPRQHPAGERAADVVLVLADGVHAQAHVVASVLGAGVPVLIWPLGAAPHALEMQPMARERGRSAAGSTRLTARERQVLALVAAGVANKGIARALGVSPNTVKFHLSALFEKLSVGSRAEAIAAAARAGEIAL